MRVALVAGETSGDLLGAGLIHAIRASVPDAEFEGVAGPEMAAAGCEVIEQAEALAVFGIIEPLARIPGLLRLRRSLVRRWTERPPDVFVGIDAPDFNLGLEQRLKSAGIPTVHYVCPSVWAWRQGRVAKIAAAVDRVLCLLPFERSFLVKHNIAADFVGHPMADKMPVIPDIAEARFAAGLEGATVIAVLPGSRMTEVTRLGPVFVAAARIIESAYPDAEFVAPMATPEIRRRFQQYLDRANCRRFKLTDGDAETAISAADVVLLASGTATLQTALLGKPMVAAYRVARLTYAIVMAFDLVKVPYVSLPNLLTDEPLVPEFIQGEATPDNLARAVLSLLDDPDRRAMITDEFQSLRAALARRADRQSAAAVIEMAGR
ncbi:MAG: lipid-A-disaccharide synthase [Gammaproteobacteria bacterium]|nr:lipid-A-disaccharide synthase [Gammaproteobacteria bacterium]